MKIKIANQPMKSTFLSALCAGSLLLLAVGCSTTKRLEDGEILYTGVRKMKLIEPDSFDVSGQVKSAVKAPLSVKPNNPLWSPYIRTPLPIGLWAWNYLYTEKERGFRRWLYDRLAKNPVLISDVRPEERVKVVNEILENYGYFRATSEYEIIEQRNPKKARINYTVHIPPPSFYDSISYLSAPGRMGEIIERMNRHSLLREGDQYNLNNLVNERNRISRGLRERGYYYFRPDYIQYQADTTMRERGVSLRTRLRQDVPQAVYEPYDIGQVNVILQNSLPGQWDSLTYEGIHITYQKPMKLKPKFIARAVELKQGELYRISKETATQNNLTNLGVFRYVSLSVDPLDSLKGADSLNVFISAAFDKPLTGQFEADVTSKSNSFIGPGVTFSLRHNNIFKGAEILALRLTGSYEWQTGNNRQLDGNSSLLNSYEIGAALTLTVPRLWLPKFLPNQSSYPSKTTVQLGADLLNRSGFFRMLSFNGSLTYDFQSSRNSYHSLTPVKIVYNRLQATSKDFDRIMEENPAIANSFQNQFIPSMSYTYTYNRPFGRRQNTRLLWQTTATSAGNLTSGIAEIFNPGEVKKIFGQPFSQFVKGVTDGRIYRRFGMNNQLVTRLVVGAGYAYGNSDVLPYSEQFYVGGANSIRAFTIRSLGPGSYRPPADKAYGYYDQVGDFKLEANVEFRFKIAGQLNGAVFVDAGNIWLLKDDPNRPGGKLKLKNLAEELALGTGAGLRFDISYLVIRADLGIGIHTPYKNPEKEGYYNISKFKDGLGFHIAIGYPF